MGVYRTTGKVVRDILPFFDRRPHDGSFYRQKLVCEPDFVCKVQFLFQTLVVGEETAEMHERDAEQDDERCPQSQAVDRPPPAL